MIKKYLVYSVLISAVATVPAFYVFSLITMIVLQVLGLKTPDQTLDEVMTVSPLQFMILSFVILLVATFGAFLIKAYEKRNKSHNKAIMP